MICSQVKMKCIVALLTLIAFQYSSSVKTISGNEANPGQFPFMSSLLTFYNSQWCNGVILDKKWILTTAQCAYITLDLDTALVGTVTNNGTNGCRYKFAKIILHEGYNSTTYENDIALIQLDDEVHYDVNVQPIEIGKVGVNENCTIIGWGWTEDSMLRYSQEMTVDLETCKNISQGYDFYVGEKQICSLGFDGVRASLYDSGGALVCGGKLSGIISYSSMFSDSLPDISTRVAVYKSWIDKIISKNL